MKKFMFIAVLGLTLTLSAQIVPQPPSSNMPPPAYRLTTPWKVFYLYERPEAAGNAIVFTDPYTGIETMVSGNFMLEKLRKIQ